jgi:ankyrin repeat protein
MSSIHEAIHVGDVARVAAELDSNPSLIGTRNVLNDMPLHEAAQQSHQALVELLLKKGADVNATGNQDYTPLHYAAQEDAPELALLLIRHGADIEKRTRQGATPLQLACRTAPRVADVLIQHGANVDLNCAIRLIDVNTTHRLLKAKRGLASVASSPDRLLEDALLTRNKEILNALLSYKRHPNALELARPDSLLFRAIEQAMSDCDTTFLRELLANGASVDVKNCFGSSPLAFISKFRASPLGNPSQVEVKKEIARVLKEYGAPS